MFPMEMPHPVEPRSGLLGRDGQVSDVPVANGDQGRLAGPSGPASTAPSPKTDPTKRPSGFDPVRSIEMPEQRDEFSTTYRNPDGTWSVQLSSMPVHYRGEDGKWLRVDNTVVKTADGRLANAGNSWRVEFGPMRAGDGVRFATGKGEFSFVAKGASDVAPEIGEDGESVIYRELFPGVDVVYRIVGTGIEELVIIKRPDAATTAIDFQFDGVSFTKDGAGLDASGEGLGSIVRVSAPETFDARGRQVDLSKQILDTTAGDRGSNVRVGLDPAFVKGLPADAFPLVVDPSVSVGFGATWVHSWGVYTNNGAAYANYNDGYARVGNPYLSSTSTVRWRSTAFFDYSSQFWASVMDAYLTTTVQSGSASGARALNVFAANSDSYHYGSTARQYTLTGPPSATYSMNGSPYTATSIATGTANHTGSNLWSLYENWTRTGTWGGALLFTGDESAAYTLKKFAVSLTLTVNRWPAAPTGAWGSASNHTLSWGTNAGSDVDGDSILYNHFVKQGGTVVYQSGWISSASHAWSAPSQYWNQTLTYGTQHYDGVSWFAEAHVTSTGEGTWAVANSAPSAVNGGHTPANAALISTVTPVLSVPAASDPNGDPVQYNFITCTGGTSTWNPAVCTQSGYQSSTNWTVPAASSRFRWSQSTTWWVVTTDGVLATEGARVVATAQRTPATHPSLGFGVQPNMRPVVDVNTGNGNLTYTANDLTVSAVAARLDVIRTYNSASTNIGGFGPGWTSTWEWSLTNDTTAGTGGVSVRQPDGRVIFYGRNPDGSYRTQLGDGSTLIASPAGVPASISGAVWAMTAHDNTVYYFNAAGAFLGLKDTVGRVVRVTTSGNTQTISDLASGRTIFIDWNATPGATTSRITAVRTVPIANHGNTAIEWRYYYDANNRLSKACDPRNNVITGYCHTYTWDTSNRITNVQLPRGNNQFTLTYKPDGKIATRTDGMNKTWTFDYYTNVTFTNLQGQTVTAARRTIVTQPSLTTDTYDFDVAVRDVRVDDNDGTAEFTAYDPGGFVDAVSEDDTTTTAPSGTLTDDYTYDIDGDLLGHTLPDGSTATASYTPPPVNVGDPPPNILATYQTPNPGSAAPLTTNLTINASGLTTAQTVTGEGPSGWVYTTGTETVPGQPSQTQPPGLVKTATAPDGVVTNTTYNAAGDVLTTVTTTGVTTTFTYDEIGRMTSETVTWGTGNTKSTAYTYNKLGQTETVTESRVQNLVTGQWHQARTTTGYDANTNPTSVSIADIEPAGNGFTPDPTRTTTTEYDNNDRSWRITDPEGNITSVTFDDNGNIRTQSDARGNVTETLYDSENRPTRVTLKNYVDPANPAAPRDIVLSQTSYDELGRVQTETDARGNITRYTYAPDGQVATKVLESFDLRTGGTVNVTLEEHHYLPSGDVQWETTANGQIRTDYTYDTSGRPATQILTNTVAGLISPNRTTTFGYDSIGRQTSVTTTDGTTTTQTRTEYDTNGRIWKTIVENGATDLTTTFGYDELGRQISITDPAGNQTVTTFDVLGRSTRVTQPAVTVAVYGSAATTQSPYTQTGYNTFGEISHQRDAGANITSTTFDRNGRPIVTTYPSYTPPGATAAITPTESRTYDPAGNLVALTDRRGQTTNYTYDPLNREVRRLDPAATTGGTRGETVTRYDDAGNITWTRNQIGAITEHTYDDLGRRRTTVAVVRNATPTPDRYTTTFDYDWAGNQTIQINPNQITEWTAVYSPAGDQLRMTDAEGNATTRQYDTASRLTVETPPVGCETRNTYDQAGRQTSTGCFTGTTRVTGNDYGYDLNGNQTTITNNRGYTTSYAYDSHNQLVSVTMPTGGTSPPTTVGSKNFDSSVEGIANSYGATVATSTTARTGAASLQVTCASGWCGVVDNTSPRQPVTAGTGYTLSIWSRAATTPANVLLNVEWIDSAGNGMSTSQLRPNTTNTTTGWTNITGTIVAPPGAATAKLVVKLDNNTTVGVQYFDDYTLTASPVTLTTVATKTFEATIEGFTATQATVTTTTAEAQSGTRSMNVTPTAGGWNARDTTGIDVVAGDTYQIVGWAKRVGWGTFVVNAEWRDATNTVIREDTVGEPEMGTLWKQFSTNNLIAPAGATKLRMSFTGWTTDQWHFDNITVSRISVAAQASTSVFSYAYDARGLQTRTIDGRNNTWWTTYNTWGLEESRIEPSTTAHPALADRTFTNVYDAAGTLTREDKPGGITVTHTLDLLGRVTADSGGTAGGSRTFTYDLAGRPATLNAGTSTMTNTWTDRDQLATVTGTIGNSSFTYDPVGRMQTRTDAAGTTTYTWTSRNQLLGLADPLTNSSHTYSYNTVGTLTSDVATNGTTTLTRTYVPDAAQRIVSDTTVNTTTGTTLVATAYAYDANGNTTSKTVGPAGYPNAGTNAYTYDPAERLASWTNPANTTVSYAYDNNHNRTASGSTATTYDERNRLLTSGTTTNSWTPRGSLSSTITGGVPTTYTYNGLDQLTNVGASTAYTYDALGRTQTRNTATFRYSGHHNQPVDNGTTLTSYGPSNAPIAIKQGATPYHLVDNNHHDITTTISTTGSVVDTIAYDPWGTTVSRSGTTSIPLGYQASYSDPSTSLVNMGARWYQSQSGSFIARDTFSGVIGAPISSNRYLYGIASPIDHHDPDGLRCRGRAYDRDPNLNAFGNLPLFVATDPKGNRFETYIPCGRAGAAGYGWKHILNATGGANHLEQIRANLSRRAREQYNETMFAKHVRYILENNRLVTAKASGKTSRVNWKATNTVIFENRNSSGRVLERYRISLVVIVSPTFLTVTTAYAPAVERLK